jgi:shikimate dehydrogenase
MTESGDIEAIQACLNNALELSSANQICGVVGDSPSHYSKSPAIWNAVFERLGLDCAYFPMDVSQDRLPALFRALKASQKVLGVNITVPYKSTVLKLLDGLDRTAEPVQAVNTVVRTPQGKLIGHNTDGQGFLNSILNPWPLPDRPFIGPLRGMNALIIGAGGSARAIAFSLAEHLESGGLFISNRTIETASALSQQLKSRLPTVRAIAESEIDRCAPQCGLIVNCSLKGQGGIRQVAPGTITVLEPYSALAPANPATFQEAAGESAGFYRDWLAASLIDIERNHHASIELVLSVPQETAFYDVIYFPLETVLLRHARLSGHRTLNGKGMIVAQAVEAFFKVCAPLLEGRVEKQADRTTVTEIMQRAW